MSEEKPVIVDKKPVAVDIVAGKTYAWCSCGLSEKQPFCDGAHSDTDFMPKMFTAEETKTAYFCLCKHSGNPVFCDGAHSKL